MVQARGALLIHKLFHKLLACPGQPPLEDGAQQQQQSAPQLLDE